VTFSAWLDLPGVITPADIAHGFIERRKPPHHDKVQSRGSKTEEEEIVLNVASIHKGHFATKTEGRTVEKEID
jgi:hypothetical protein